MAARVPLRRLMEERSKRVDSSKGDTLDTRVLDVIGTSWAASWIGNEESKEFRSLRMEERGFFEVEIFHYFQEKKKKTFSWYRWDFGSKII